MQKSKRMIIVFLLLIAADFIAGSPSELAAQSREIGNLIIDGIPDIPPRIAGRMNQYQNVRSAGFLDWNPNGAGILISTRFGEANQIHYVERPGGARQQLTFFKEPVGGGSYYTSDEAGEFQQLTYYELVTGKKTTISGNLGWNVTGLALSDDGRRFAYVTNEDGMSKLYVFDLQTNWEKMDLPPLPVGLIGGLEFSKDGNELGMTLNTSQTSGDAYSINLASKELVRWTFSEVGGLKTDKFVAPQLIRYGSHNSRSWMQRASPRSAPGGIWRRARSENARVSAQNLPDDECQ